MIKALYYSPDQRLIGEPKQDLWKQYLADLNGLLWVDFENTSPIEDEIIMREIFGFHPLAIDDALQETHIPKIDDWGNYLYIVLQAVSANDQGDILIGTKELDVFLGRNFILTHHDFPIDPLEKVWHLVQRDTRHLHSGADHLLYRLIDELVTSYMLVVDSLDQAIDQVEDDVFNELTSRTLERIFDLKRAAVMLRRIVNPEREVLNKLARDDFEVIDEADKVYFRDLYDHLVRMVDITEGVRDLVGSVLDTYMSAVNNRMNDIMKTLTIITTLFMPLTFLTGFFGMNFFAPSFPLGKWTESYAFYISLSLIVLTPGFMYLWMRRRRWM
jgi:magnesium transporter